ncbi:hypothetical protein ABPG75_009231 [Micractinium tetrahymenae]
MHADVQFPIASCYLSITADQSEVFVLDGTFAVVQRFKSDGTFISWFGLSMGKQLLLDMPWAIAASPLAVCVTDLTGSQFGKWSISGSWVGGPWGGQGNDEGNFNSPQGIAVAKTGQFVYVCDDGNGRVQASRAFLEQGSWTWKFKTSNGEYVSQLGSLGTGDGRLTNCYSLTVDGAGAVYVNDNGAARVFKFSSTGNFSAAYGSAGTADGQFRGLDGLAAAWDTSGTVWAADDGAGTPKGRIQKLLQVL